jgi:predicted transcriptional regulator
MTKKQRLKKYTEAAMKIDLGLESYCCYALTNSFTTEEKVISKFPEFALFKPRKDQVLSNLWFGMAGYYEYQYDGFIKNTQNQNARIFCLLLCAEMCKD